MLQPKRSHLPSPPFSLSPLPLRQVQGLPSALCRLPMGSHFPAPVSECPRESQTPHASGGSNHSALCEGLLQDSVRCEGRSLPRGFLPFPSSSAASLPGLTLSRMTDRHTRYRHVLLQPHSKPRGPCPSHCTGEEEEAGGGEGTCPRSFSQEAAEAGLPCTCSWRHLASSEPACSSPILSPLPTRLCSPAPGEVSSPTADQLSPKPLL